MKAEQIVKAARAKEKLAPRGDPSAIVPYRFTEGNEAWKGGARQEPIDYIRSLTRRMRESSPPKEMCAEIGIDPSVTWGEAIFFALGTQGVLGDVMSAREFLAALGFSGTAAKNLVAIQQNAGEMTGVTVDFLKHSHGLTDSQLGEVFAFMDAMPREAIVVDASYLPPVPVAEDENEPA